jgi:hypothetical protein
MFTWVCPNCGKELDLAVKECPECRERAALPGTASRPPDVVTETAEASKRFWIVLISATVAAVLALVLIGRYRSAHPAAPAAPTGTPKGITLENVPTTSTAPARQLEIAGIRMSYDDRSKPQVRAVVINHGDEGLQAVSAVISLRPASSPADAQPLARFTVKLTPELKPGESREVKAPLDALATLAAMPPWHQLRADVELR